MSLSDPSVSEEEDQEDAITAAQATATGDLAEVNLEMYQGYLVDNVNLGDRDVKIDAEDGTVSGHGTSTITGNRLLSVASSAV